MFLRQLALTAAASVCVGAGAAEASPLTMTYQVTDLGGGRFTYQFTLTLDNHDGTWAPGMGWGWLVFGDAPSPGPSPMADFSGNASDLPVGPWKGFTSSGGGHNGPTLSYVLDVWVPTAVGQSLTWSGTSAVNLEQGQLLWSSLHRNGRTPIVELEVATKVIKTPPPCPADYDHNGAVEPADVSLFISTWVGSLRAQTLAGDFDGNGIVQPADVSSFVSEWFGALAAGC